MVNPDEDTEFNDALRAHGILPPKPPSRSPSPDIPTFTSRDIASIATASQLSNLLENDNLDSDDERMFEDYRRKRLAEVKREEKRGRFGSMEGLGREDFVREVTEGSKVEVGDEGEILGADEEEDEEEGDEKGVKSPKRLKGTGVVVFLFKDSVPLSQHLRPLLTRLAQTHTSTKFLSIPSTQCIPNYPDKNVPTLLVYRNGEMVGNIIAGMGLRGMKTTVRDLESLLLRYRALEKPSTELMQESRKADADDSDEDDDLLDDGQVGMVNNRSGGIRTGGASRMTGQEDEDSDFDM